MLYVHLKITIIMKFKFKQENDVLALIRMKLVSFIIHFSFNRMQRKILVSHQFSFIFVFLFGLPFLFQQHTLFC